jgi:UDP-N-acetylmuramate dehydrogenase
MRIEPTPDVPLAALTTLGIGGAARWFVAARTDAEIAAADLWCADRGVPLVVLGGGSNLVVSDDGIDGLVLHIATTGCAFESRGGEETLVDVAAGTSWDTVVAGAVERGLAGLECLSGIPGSTGGTPVQNVGAYGQEVADTIEHVTAWDRLAHETRRLPAGECGFAYRTSRFKRDDAGRFIITGVSFRLRAGDPTTTYADVRRWMERRGVSRPSLTDVRSAVLEARRAKGMVLDAGDPDTRSVGSFFTNPIVDAGVHDRIASIAGEAPPAFTLEDGRMKIPAAWLIERAGFPRGWADGAVGLSSKHPLAIVNRGGATAADVVHAAARIKRRVDERFEVRLRPEPVFVGFHGDPDLDYLQTADDSCRHC